MVPINFHRYRQELKQALLAHKERLSSEWDAFIAAWTAYALSQEGIQDNAPLEELAATLQRWIGEDQSWEHHRNLGPLAFSCWLTRQMGKPCDVTVVRRLWSGLRSMRADNKLSVLRDCEQVFLLALGLSAVEGTAISADEAKARLAEVAKQEVEKSTLRRRVLYAAALREMGESVSVQGQGPQDAGDMIALVWWAERYGDGQKKREQWCRFASVKDMIAVDTKEAGETQRILSVPELAMLYEAVCHEAFQPDLMLVFENFPFHPKVRAIAQEYFQNEKYVTAVFEACKKLNEVIQEKSGVKDSDEVKLVQSTMKQVGDATKLKIKFNNFLHERSGRDEQAGLALICEGVFKAFRNPKGHKPEDHPIVQIGPKEALYQLVVVSYLMERVEEAHSNDLDNAGSV